MSYEEEDTCHMSDFFPMTHDACHMRRRIHVI